MKKFGKFELLERIGEGGMAEIYLARPLDAALSKLVALKRILPEHSDRPNFQEMFVHEGEIALRFRHPSIVTVHEVGQVGKQYYMTMEYFPGKTLAQLVGKLRDGKGQLDIADKVFIIKAIADALQYIHDFSDYGGSTEIIHRDISPQNIMVGFDGAAKLIDFGVAKVNQLDRGTDTKDIKGKFAYMSPEQIRGEKLTKRTDIFSLGVVFWELLNSKKLFTGKTVDEVTKQVMSFEEPKLVDFSTEVPYSLCKVCQKCLARNPQDRFQSAGELSRELDDFLRKAMDGSHQRRVADAMSVLFPEDISRLRAQLKKYEQRSGDEATVLAEDSTDTLKLDEIEPARPVKLIENPQAPKPRPSRASTNWDSKSGRGQKKKPSSWLAPAFWALVLSGAVIAIGSFVHGIWPRQLGVASGKKTKTDKTEMASVPPAEEFEKIVINPTPLPHRAPPAPAPEHRPAVEPPQPPPKIPAPAPVAVREEPPAVKPSARTEIKKPKPPVPHAVEKRVTKKAERKKKAPEKSRAVRVPPPEAPKAERKIATTIRPPVAPQATAILTVLADPEAQIFVDDKSVGMELVNNLKVAADKKLLIKVVGKGGQPVKMQTLTLKPFSSNVIDMASTPADKP